MSSIADIFASTIVWPDEDWEEEANYKEYGDDNFITFYFWEADTYVKYSSNALMELRNGKKHKAKDLIVGDVIKNSLKEWAKITSIDG